VFPSINIDRIRQQTISVGFGQVRLSIILALLSLGSLDYDPFAAFIKDLGNTG
jgi:hypothetical protein